MAKDPLEGQTLPSEALARRTAKLIGCEGAHKIGDAWGPCESPEALKILIRRGAPAYREWRSKQQTKAHDLIFYENRSTPQVVSRGASGKPKKGYGRQTRRRAATAEEERQIRAGQWVRVDQGGNKPSSGKYKRTRYRPQLLKKRVILDAAVEDEKRKRMKRRRRRHRLVQWPRPRPEDWDELGEQTVVGLEGGNPGLTGRRSGSF